MRDLFDAIDGDRIEAAARAATGQAEPDDAAMDAARDKLVSEAANVFTGPLIELLDTIRRDHEQTIDHDNLDTLLAAEWAGDTTENAKAIAADFEDWLTAHRDEIEALSIYFTQPARRSAVTYRDDQGAARRASRPTARASPPPMSGGPMRISTTTRAPRPWASSPSSSRSSAAWRGWTRRSRPTKTGCAGTSRTGS